MNPPPTAPAPRPTALVRMIVTVAAATSLFFIGFIPSEASPVRWPYMIVAFLSGVVATVWNWRGLRATSADRKKWAGMVGSIVAGAWTFLAGVPLLIFLAHEALTR